MNRDRLYELLPAVYRIRDVEYGKPLEAVLQIIGEQVDLVEEDIAQLYDNWFIETCEDWVVPYIAELIGYRPVADAGQPGVSGAGQDLARRRILIPRREVANTILYRRRKGTLAVLEALANDIAGWPARAVEYYTNVAWNQALNHLHLDRARTVDVRHGAVLGLSGSPFDLLGRSLDVRRVNSRKTVGRHNSPSVAVFVWRLKSYRVTQTPAVCIEKAGPHSFTFSVLGNDAPLYLKPEPETELTHIAEELNLPVPIRRAVLAEHKERLVAPTQSLFIWTGVKRGKTVSLEPVPPERIVAADLTGWTYLPRRGTVAVDPVLGRIAFPPQQPPKSGVWVSYHYGFSADMGGGEYDRPLAQPAGSVTYAVSQDATLDTIGKALDRWRTEQPRHAVIEIGDSRVYVEPIHVEFSAGQESLQLRAANGRRPVIRLLDWQTSQPDALTVFGKGGDRFVLDGIMVTGRGLQVSGDLKQLTIRHATLVPGWGLDSDCRPQRPTEPSLEVFSPNVCVIVEHSIVGSIQINPLVPPPAEDSAAYADVPEFEVQQARCEGTGPDVRLDPIRLCIRDSIVDATSRKGEAIGTPGCPVAHAVLTIARCTVIGQVQVRAIELGENSIFNGRITVARRQHGCLRFSYVTPESRTPPRFHCQPDLVSSAAARMLRDEAAQGGLPPPTETEIAAAQHSEWIRVRPQFNSRRYGTPTYCQLAMDGPAEIARGADDDSEMGAFHDLFQPQREANLRARLDEFVPSGADVGIILAS
jgi:hypothetical protein